MTRTVAVVTGTRAEYGLLRSTMAEISSAADLSLQTVATGMHLSPQHGYTVEEIRADGYNVDFEVEMLFRGDSGASMARSLGAGLVGMTRTFEHLEPDVVLVLGDRNEAFAGGVAAAQMGIPLAHVHGGDAMTGATIDDSIRHALTKFAHLHFPATEASAGRIERLGEEPWRITTVGAPGLDQVRRGEYEDPSEVRERFGFDTGEPLILALQHPETVRPEEAGSQMRATLDAIERVDAQTLLVYPNSDAGSQSMIDEIELRPEDETFTAIESLSREAFLGAMAAADVMVGNSSSGIIEAPSFGLQVVNVGERQEGRERAGKVRDTNFDATELAEAIDAALQSETEPVERASNPYDAGGAGSAIVDRLAGVGLDSRLLRKRITH